MSDIELSEIQKVLSQNLTHLQRGFVINLVKGMSQRQAYKAAGGRCKKDVAIDAAASRMLADVRVRAFYDSLMESAAKGAVLTRQEAMEFLTTIIRSTPKDVANFRKVEIGKDGDGDSIYQSYWELKGDDELEDTAARLISELTASPQGLKFKMHNQLQALKQLIDMLGWDAPKKVAETDPEGNPVETKYKNVKEDELDKRIAELMGKLKV